MLTELKKKKREEIIRFTGKPMLNSLNHTLLTAQVHLHIKKMNFYD